MFSCSDLRKKNFGQSFKMIIYYNMRIDIWNSCLFQTILTTFQYWQFLNQGCFQKVYIIWLPVSIRLLNDSGTCFSITKMEYISHALWYSLTHSMYEMFNRMFCWKLINCNRKTPLKLGAGLQMEITVIYLLFST